MELNFSLLSLHDKSVKDSYETYKTISVVSSNQWKNNLIKVINVIY